MRTNEKLSNGTRARKSEPKNDKQTVNEPNRMRMLNYAGFENNTNNINPGAPKPQTPLPHFKLTSR